MLKGLLLGDRHDVLGLIYLELSEKAREKNRNDPYRSKLEDLKEWPTSLSSLSKDGTTIIILSGNHSG